MMDVDRIIAEIAASFQVLPVPDARDAIMATYMVEHLHENLGGRAWSNLTGDQCRICSDGFTFLTPKGLHYYLPAYMTAAIRDAEEADVVVDSLIGLFQNAPRY